MNVNKLITFLFCLSIILINPFGVDRGLIWSQPKILAIELICITNLFIISQEKLYLSKSGKIIALLWGIFLLVGAIATINSLQPMRSLFGHSTAKDGLLYWTLIACFTLSNALVLKLKPEIGKQQLKGLVIGGVVLALSIFPQSINWHIDYTVTSGQLLKNHILQSTIYREQQPIGLYSHRGFASFSLAAIGIITLVGWRWKWINKKLAVLTYAVIIPALLLTQTRAGLLAFVIGAGYLLGRKHYKLILAGAFSCILIISIISANRNIQNHSFIDQFTSNRVEIWQISIRRIKMKPLLGWGFDGFQIAFPYQPDGIVKTQLPLASKAHNLLIDTAVSVGIIGAVVYFWLITLCLCCLLKSPYRDIGAVAIAYLIYTFTWYESAQYTHVFWWSLSFFDYEKVNYGSFISNQLSVPCNGGMVARVRSWVSRAKTAIFRKV